jgi:hypothetical protein
MQGYTGDKGEKQKNTTLPNSSKIYQKSVKYPEMND